MKRMKTETRKRTGRKEAKAKKAKPISEPLFITSLALTRSDVDILQRLAKDAEDAIGRRISKATVARALIRYVEQQGLGSQLSALIEQELNSGVVWGKKRGS